MKHYKASYSADQVRAMHLDALAEFLLHAQRTLSDPYAESRPKAAAIKGLAQITLALGKVAESQSGALSAYSPAQIKSALSELATEHGTPELKALLDAGPEAILVADDGGDEK